MRETVCTVVHQRTASLDSERGIDDGSQVHEGRRQTVRRELNSQSTGRPRLKLPAFQPDRRKSAVRNDRGDDGNGGIIRSPQRAIVLPDKLVDILAAEDYVSGIFVSDDLGPIPAAKLPHRADDRIPRQSR